MARKRMIDPKFWSDDKIIELDDKAKLLFIGLWNFSDDVGIHRYNEKTIKAEIFPIDEITPAKVKKIVDILIESGLLIKWKDDEYGELLFIKGWYTYQYLKKPTPSNYSLPRNIFEGLKRREQNKYMRAINYWSKQDKSSDDDVASDTSVTPVRPNRKEKNEIESKENLKEDYIIDSNRKEFANSSQRLYKALQEGLIKKMDNH